MRAFHEVVQVRCRVYRNHNAIHQVKSRTPPASLELGCEGSLHDLRVLRAFAQQENACPTRAHSKSTQILEGRRHHVGVNRQVQLFFAARNLVGQCEARPIGGDANVSTDPWRVTRHDSMEAGQ